MRGLDCLAFRRCKKMNVGKGQKVVPVDTPPNGLRQTQLCDAAPIEAALLDVEALLRCELRGQIASNQHCYVNLPHPLTVHNYRESHVPLFHWGERRELIFGSARAKKERKKDMRRLPESRLCSVRLCVKWVMRRSTMNSRGGPT